MEKHPAMLASLNPRCVLTAPASAPASYDSLKVRTLWQPGPRSTRAGARSPAIPLNSTTLSHGYDVGKDVINDGSFVYI
ncbi:Laccase-1 [Anopheles sinensis]|uniref:Laccase-1 n=1 Tax=Anopheles sinensis TaxID=74873 RepID=A0A084WUU8_ANOSI|nr:Laccase-1 [Anopheles sinensis]